jgi:hypothetical protein
MQIWQVAVNNHMVCPCCQHIPIHIIIQYIVLHTNTYHNTCKTTGTKHVVVDSNLTEVATN